MTEKVVKARKVYTCIVCEGNIQKGEKYIHLKDRCPKYDDNDIQIGIEYHEYRYHDKDCYPRLLGLESTEKILKNCNFGIHTPVHDMDPDRFDGSEWCEWCGIEL